MVYLCIKKLIKKCFWTLTNYFQKERCRNNVRFLLFLVAYNWTKNMELVAAPTLRIVGGLNYAQFGDWVHASRTHV